MILSKLVLRQFRSYRDLTLTVQPGVNLFLGLNGTGKTNLLEAIAVLTTGSSPRGSETENLVQWNEEGFFIGGNFKKEQEPLQALTLEMKYQHGSARTIRENGKTVVRLKDLIGRIPLVSFVPEDLMLIKGEPSLRRKAVNMILMQVDGTYAATLKKYNEAVRSRNAALKHVAEGQLERQALLPWDQALIEHGLVLFKKRHDFINDFSGRARGVHARVSGGKETLTLHYKPSFEAPWDETAAQRWNQKILSLRPQELALGMTMTGPHRDDVVFLLNNRPARAYASEGQRRTGALSFKLAEIPYIEEKIGQRPLCLLDDVLSELDVERAAHLLDELSRTGQCFVTLTGLESWPKDHALPAAIYKVNGTGVELEKTAHEINVSQV